MAEASSWPHSRNNRRKKPGPLSRGLKTWWVTRRDVRGPGQLGQRTQGAHPPGKGNKDCIVEVSPSGRAPCSPSQGCHYLHPPPLRGIRDQLRAAFPGSAEMCRDYTRHHLSVRVPWTSALYFPGIPARTQDIGPGHSFQKDARPVREKMRVRVQAPK